MKKIILFILISFFLNEQKDSFVEDNVIIKHTLMNHSHITVCGNEVSISVNNGSENFTLHYRYFQYDDNCINYSYY